MSESKAPQRLGKAAVALGVGKDTIVEFLAKKGIVIENNPMAKLEADVMDILAAEFSTDQKAKEKTAAVAAKTKESRETITIEDKKKRGDGREEEEPEIDLDRFKRKPEPAKAKPVAVAPPKEEEKPVEVTPPAPPAEEPAPVHVEEVVAETPKVEEVAPEPTEPEERQVKVLGKIDLSALEKPKSRGKKKEETPTEKPAAKGKKKEEPKEVVAPKVETTPEVPVAEVPAAIEAEPEKVAPEEKELIRVKVEKLAGTKLMGHIVLPTSPAKKEAAKPAVDPNAEKKKRKRVGKVDISRQQESDRKNNNNNNNNNRNRPQGGNAGGNNTGNAGAKPQLNEQDIQNQIRETLARLGGPGKSKSSKNRREKRDQVARRQEEQAMRDQAESTILKLTEFVTVSELATMMSKGPTEIIQVCMQLGIFASINQRLDAETIHIIAEEFGYEVQFVSAEVTETVTEEPDNPEDLVPRPPVVTVMGHVDHGKTSLLDFIRSANVVAGEAGGITQHIGAYNVKLPNGKSITFLDTPGHEAFTAMRARGAQVTDLAIIVIAADDSVMPQTKEAISHAQAAGVPMIFAINKVDKPDANPERIREQLAQLNVLVEEWGGKYQSQEIAAKKGMNIDKLLEKVLLESELLDLKANPNKRAVGTIIESSLDKGRGYVATLLVEGGTLRVGDPILAGQWSGRVKAMFNERGQKVTEAGPASPVSILGFEGAPNAGDKFYAMEDEREARNLATKRQQLQREQRERTKKHLTIEEIGRRIALGDFKELNLIVKGDVDGSVEALVDSLQKLSTEKIQVRIIHKGVGQISESDVLLATASDAIIVGFQVRPSPSARKLAETEEIQIRLYSIIYKAIEEIKEAMEGMLSAKIEEQITGTIEIREVFKISKVGTVAGAYVQDGKVDRKSRIRVIRDGIVIHTGTLESLKRFKDDVKEVSKGYECGLNIEKFNNIEVGDIIEAFEEVEVKQTL
jgi:translation initiation factor IF-2